MDKSKDKGKTGKNEGSSRGVKPDNRKKQAKKPSLSVETPQKQGTGAKNETTPKKTGMKKFPPRPDVLDSPDKKTGNNENEGPSNLNENQVGSSVRGRKKAALTKNGDPDVSRKPAKKRSIRRRAATTKTPSAPQENAPIPPIAPEENESKVMTVHATVNPEIVLDVTPAAASPVTCEVVGEDNTKIAVDEASRVTTRTRVSFKSSAEKEKKRGSNRDRNEGNSAERSCAAPNANKLLARKWFLDVVTAGVDAVRAEYKYATAETPSSLCLAFKSNMDSNRYNNMSCLDATRVKLAGEHDYIHANYVGLFPTNPKRFICAQGPMVNTCAAFWRMVLQEECEIIVMLCDLMERNREKCAAYFPTKEEPIKKFDDITIALKNIVELPDVQPTKIFISRFAVSRGEKTVLSVCHYHWRNWPDHGVPTNFSAPLTLLADFRKTTRPILVHCSAGVGRTGTLVMIGAILEQLHKGTGFPGVAATLEKLRSQRSFCVQNDLQYLYIHRCILEYMVSRRVVKKPGDEWQNFAKGCEPVLVDKSCKNRRSRDKKSAPSEGKPE